MSQTNMEETRANADRMPEFDRTMPLEKITAILKAEREYVVDFAKSVQEFSAFDTDTKVELLAVSWNILVIIGIAHRSQPLVTRDHLTLLMASGDELSPGSMLAEKIGISARNFGLILHQALPRLRDANVDHFEAYCLMTSKLLCKAEGTALHPLCSKFYEYCKKQVSDESWRDRVMEILVTISESLENIADSCTMQKYFLFPDNQPLEPFLLDKFQEADGSSDE